MNDSFEEDETDTSELEDDFNRLLSYITDLRAHPDTRHPNLDTFLKNLIHFDVRSELINRLQEEEPTAIQLLFDYLTNDHLPIVEIEPAPKITTHYSQDDDDERPWMKLKPGPEFDWFPYTSVNWADTILKLSANPPALLNETQENLNKKIAFMERKIDKTALLCELDPKRAMHLINTDPGYLKVAPMHLLQRLFHEYNFLDPDLKLAFFKHHLNQETMVTLLDEVFSEPEEILTQLDQSTLEESLSLYSLLQSKPWLVKSMCTSHLIGMLFDPTIENKKEFIAQLSEGTIEELTQQIEQQYLTNDRVSLLQAIPYPLKYAKNQFVYRMFFSEPIENQADAFCSLSELQQQQIADMLEKKETLQKSELQLLTQFPKLINPMIAKLFLKSMNNNIDADFQAMCFNAFVLPYKDTIFQSISANELIRFISSFNRDQLTLIADNIEPILQKSLEEIKLLLPKLNINEQKQFIVKITPLVLKTLSDFISITSRLSPMTQRGAVLFDSILDSKKADSILQSASVNELNKFLTPLTLSNMEIAAPSIIKAMQSLSDFNELLMPLSQEKRDILFNQIKNNPCPSFLDIFFNQKENLPSAIPICIAEAKNPMKEISDFLSELTLFQMKIIAPFIIPNKQSMFYLIKSLSYLTKEKKEVLFNQIKNDLPKLLDQADNIISTVKTLILSLPKELVAEALSILNNPIRVYINGRTLDRVKEDEDIRHTLPKELSKLIPPMEVKRTSASSANFSVMTHGLGLKGVVQDGMNNEDANKSLKARYLQVIRKIKPFFANEKPLQHDLAQEPSLLERLNSITRHGDMQGIHARWPGHSFSFYLLKEQGKTHFIYVNRGRWHEQLSPKTHTVMVFTVTSEVDVMRLTKSLHNDLMSSSVERISSSLTELHPYLNPSLSLQLSKSEQKVGNCSMANSNIAWHFALVSQLMKQNPDLSFSEAYQQTKPIYKDMRMEDRANLFCDLIMNWKNWELPVKVSLGVAVDSRRYQFSVDKDNLNQVIEKMVRKDFAKPDKERVKFLLLRLKENHPDLLLPLFATLTEQPFLTNDPDHWMLYCKLVWAQAILDLAGNTLDDGTKKTAQETITQLSDTIDPKKIQDKLPCNPGLSH